MTIFAELQEIFEQERARRRDASNRRFAEYQEKLDAEYEQILAELEAV